MKPVFRQQNSKKNWNNKLFYDILRMNMNALRSFETSGYVKLPATQRNIPEDQSSEEKCRSAFWFLYF